MHLGDAVDRIAVTAAGLGVVEQVDAVGLRRKAECRAVADAAERLGSAALAQVDFAAAEIAVVRELMGMVSS
ncbi:hypothetical protein PUV44_12500 [Xanthomonas arboricola pv. corylina]|nr:hypothetical protein PUV44_12500 [Xanthomonas arboricola pv. corylina]